MPTTPADQPTEPTFDTWIADFDARLATAEAAFAAAKAAETARREQAVTALRAALAQLPPRRERAEAIGAADLVAELAARATGIQRELDDHLGWLGYDPDQRRAAAEAERRAAEQQAAAERREAWLAKLAKADGEPRLYQLAKELAEGLHHLLLPDALVVHRALLAAFAERRATPPEPLAAFVAEFEPIAASPEAAARFRSHCEAVQQLRARRQAAAKEVDDLHQAAIRLETGWAKLHREAVHATIQELCCRGKRLQRDCGDVLSDRQHELLYKEVFGKLGNVQKRANCGFVPALQKDWFPVDLDAEIERQRAIVASRAPQPAPAAPAAEELPQRDRDRLRQAELWVLAEAYREVTAYERDQDAGAVERLRRTVAHACEFLKDLRDRLPDLLVECESLFAEGSEFRWLRKQLQKRREEAAAPPPAETGAEPAEEPAEAAPEIEAPSGTVLHPSIARVRTWTEGKRILLVGGTPDDARREKVRSLLAAAAVEWTPASRFEGTGRLQQAAQQVAAGSHDLVVYLLGYLSHKATGIVDEAVAARPLPVARVRRGTGPVGIAEAILAAVRADRAA